jgi:hypothetical protein
MSAEGQPLSLALAAEIEPALSVRRARLGKDCISELSFSNFYLFRDAHRYRYFRGDWPHIVGSTYDGAIHVTPLFNICMAPQDVLRSLLVGRDCFYPLAAKEVDALDPKIFVCQNERDDSDYLYPAQNFLDYAGTPLRKKRQALSQLQASHSLTCTPLSAANLNDVCYILREWMADKQKQPGEADEPACRDALVNATAFGLEGWVFHADGAPAGFTLAQSLATNVMAMRFAKGLVAYPGIYPWMFQACCRQWEGRVEWLNFEQDLGNPNFRRTKLSFEPASLLEKFRVRLRNVG